MVALPAEGAFERTARSPVLVCVVTFIPVELVVPAVLLVPEVLPEPAFDTVAVEPLVPVALVPMARGAVEVRFWAEAVTAPRARTTETAI